MFKRAKIINISIVVFLLNTIVARAQCTTLGQNPETAFPVCGTDIFSMVDVPICGDRIVPGRCNSYPYSDKNPFWYKFRCFTAGTLGFQIKPNTISDDYDWQLFDVTGKNPGDVYTNVSMFVACNWSGEGGITGAGTAGTSLVECDGFGVPVFSKMPTLVQGHDYILLVSHFSDSQSGYSLFFSGGTANITDPVNPSLLGARASCDGTHIGVKLNKDMKCSSLAADGSDFSVSPAVGNIISAEAISCSSGFDMDSVVITLDAAIAPGNYTISIETGSDSNNLLDNCNRSIPPGQVLPVTVYPLVPTPMDSITRTKCAPSLLELVFRDQMDCNSIAADGSDFVLTGPAGITVTGASGNCGDNGLTTIVRVMLSAPITAAGTYKLMLKTGGDGNTLINECAVETPAGSSVNFSAADTVSALFSYQIRAGCVSDNVDFSHNGLKGVNSWKWSFDNISANAKDTTINYTVSGVRQISLAVSNGTCHDTASATIDLAPHVKAGFQAPVVICPGDPVDFVENSTGPVVTWQWSFGNGNVSTQQKPASQIYPSANVRRDFPLQLIVKGTTGCADTTSKIITAVGNCYIAVPKGFSPNNDGLNDYLYPTNAYKARDLLFRVFNRSGQQIFETRDWTNKWDGSFKGNPQDPGTYVWILQYNNIDTGKRFELKGSTVLIR